MLTSAGAGAYAQSFVDSARVHSTTGAVVVRDSVELLTGRPECQHGCTDMALWGEYSRVSTDVHVLAVGHALTEPGHDVVCRLIQHACQ